MKVKEDIKRNERGSRKDDTLKDVFDEFKKGTESGKIKVDLSKFAESGITPQQAMEGLKAHNREMTMSIADEVIDEEQNRNKRKMRRDRQADIDDADDYLEAKDAKCNCVHGTCPPGSSKCGKCDDGWRGPLCNVPTDAKDFAKKNPRMIEDDEEEEEIFKPNKIRD